MRKIDSIDSTGKVLFVDDKGTGTTTGSKEDCLAYGYNYTGSACYIQNNNKSTQTKGNTNLDKANNVRGANNNILGKGNNIQAKNVTVLGNSHKAYYGSDNSTLIGRNAYTENYGEIAMSSAVIPNRAKFSIYQYNGITTDDSTTEIYLGGKDGYKLYINTDYESAYAIDYTACALNASSNEIWTEYGRCTYKYVNNTLTEVGHQKGTTIRDSALDYACDFAPHTHDAIHISLDVTGETGHTAYWTVVLRVTEVRYA